MSVWQPVPWPSVPERDHLVFVWFYFRFGVSFGDLEEAMASRGVLVSYETVRRWCDKFGHLYTTGLRNRRPRTGDKWHLDEVFLSINDVRHYLWRTVDQKGVVIDILVQPKRDRFAAMRFFRKLLLATGGRRPRVIVTDKLRSYGRREADRDARCRSSAAPMPRRHLLSAADYRHLRSNRFGIWNEVTEAPALA
jgi:transposase-like protein